jgi:hypothetical protein
MSFPQISVFEVPTESISSKIDEITTLSNGNVTIICIRNGVTLQLRCLSRSKRVTSLRLSLPKEDFNRVISARLISISPQFLVNILTFSGTLITLNLSKYLINDTLPGLVNPIIRLDVLSCQISFIFVILISFH